MVKCSLYIGDLFVRKFSRIDTIRGLRLNQIKVSRTARLHKLAITAAKLVRSEIMTTLFVFHLYNNTRLAASQPLAYDKHLAIALQ